MVIYSLIASPGHPRLSALFERLGAEALSFTSERKAIQQLKKTKPDVVIADFVYGYGNDYAGITVSNLDVFLYSLQKEAPRARVIVLAQKDELQYVEKLNGIVAPAAVLAYPVGEADVAALLAP
jgi:DNA-binding NarL/FixJ family response regulator